jgi:hypothetical protein
LKKILLLIFCAAGLVCAGRDAAAFKLDGDKWTLNRGVMMHLSLGGFQPLQDGFNSFNDVAAD